MDSLHVLTWLSMDPWTAAGAALEGCGSELTAEDICRGLERLASMQSDAAEGGETLQGAQGRMSQLASRNAAELTGQVWCLPRWLSAELLPGSVLFSQPLQVSCTHHLWGLTGPEQRN
jgi:hypothetical protein